MIRFSAHFVSRGFYEPRSYGLFANGTIVLGLYSAQLSHIVDLYEKYTKTGGRHDQRGNQLWYRGERGLLGKLGKLICFISI